MRDFLDNISFPYHSVREGQDEFLKKVDNCILNNKNLMVLAPTGLGKTVSALAPAIAIAKEKKMTVICLTSRQTQANQVIKTIKDICLKSKEKDETKEINYLAFIGKRNMCVHHNRDLYPAQDFNEFCKKMRETGRCKFYKNVKNSENEKKVKAVLDESSKNFLSVEGFVDLAKFNTFCPYELASKKAYKADVVVCDYNYMFSQGIAPTFLGKIGRDLDECILIVDEAHNLPDRIRSSYSYSMSTDLVKNALKELKDFVKTSEFDSFINNIYYAIEEIFFSKKDGDKTDYLVSRVDFLEKYIGSFSGKVSFKDIIDKLKDIEIVVKDQRIISFVGRVAVFLDKWYNLDEENYLRVLERSVIRGKEGYTLTIRCIDPGFIAKDILNSSVSSILMSGTLFPLEMYRDLLEVEKVELLELKSPFLEKNQLTLVVNDVTTKYSARTIDMYKKIANHIEGVLVGGIKQNAIVFFPSYLLLDKVLDLISLNNLEREVLKEERFMTKEQKEEFVEKFKEKGLGLYGEKSKVLFAVTSGSFAEGLDLPDESLEMVVVVGLPLGVPDLYTNSVINHFDKKFRKGQMYGYVYPAMNKIVQAGGRCIRTESDKGVVILMDNRFLWPMYAQTFPRHWKLKRVQNDRELRREVLEFFG